MNEVPVQNEDRRIRCCFEGDYLSPSGEGRIMRELLPAARGLEMPISLQLRRGYQHQPEFTVMPFLAKVAQRPPSGRVRIFCQPAFALSKPEGGGILWAVTSFSHVAVTKAELDNLKRFARIFVPSFVHEDLLAKAGIPRGKLGIFTPGVDQKRFHPRELPSPRIAPDKRFTFLFVGNPTRRKGLDLLLRAYLEEFRANEPVRLVIKLTHVPKLKKHFAYEISDLGRRLGAINSLFPTVQVIDETVPDEEMPHLLKCAQILVSTSRCYHHALIIREAFAVGVPVLGPRSLEGIAGLSEKNGFLVNTVKAKMPAGELFPDSPEATVEEPDLQDLRATMRRAFQQRESLREKGRTARKEIAQAPSWPAIAEHLFNHYERERKAAPETGEPAPARPRKETAKAGGSPRQEHPRHRPARKSVSESRERKPRREVREHTPAAPATTADPAGDPTRKTLRLPAGVRGKRPGLRDAHRGRPGRPPARDKA